MTSVATNANADAWNKKTYVTISQSIEVPGAILAPGKYVFKLMENESNPARYFPSLIICNLVNDAIASS